MSIIAKLYIDDKTFNILKFNVSFNQKSSNNGLPSATPTGGRFNIVLETTKDTLFHEWMIGNNTMKNLKIKLSPSTMNGKSKTIELLDVYCLQYQESFDGVNNQPMMTYMQISPAIMVQDGVKIFEWYWKVTDLSANVEQTQVDNEPEIMNYRIEDMGGKVLEKDEIDVGEEIMLVIESSNAIGETFEFDLDDQKLDYEHNGVKLRDDSLEVLINNNIERVPLKAIIQED